MYKNAWIDRWLDLLDAEVSPIRREEIAVEVLKVAKQDYALIEIGTPRDDVLSPHRIDWRGLGGCVPLLQHAHLLSITPIDQELSGQ